MRSDKQHWRQESHCSCVRAEALRPIKWSARAYDSHLPAGGWHKSVYYLSTSMDWSWVKIACNVSSGMSQEAQIRRQGVERPMLCRAVSCLLAHAATSPSPPGSGIMEQVLSRGSALIAIARHVVPVGQGLVSKDGLRDNSTCQRNLFQQVYHTRRLGLLSLSSEQAS